MIYINRFFFGFYNQIRKFYLNSKIYDKKISKVSSKELFYKPSPHLLSSLIKYHKKKFKIEDISLDEIWDNQNISQKEFKNLNSFYWFFSLDLRSSKQAVQSIITDWIQKNQKYNNKSWDFDLTAKRIIAWLSSHNLTYDESDQNFKDNFNKIIQKQTNHLINEVNTSKIMDDKLIGCASIILVGLCYQDNKKYLSLALLFRKKLQNYH